MRSILVTALLLIGCGASAQQGSAAAPRAGSTSSGNDDDVRCQDEVPTGTLHHRTVCRDQAERDGEQKNVERWMKMPRANPSGN